MPSIDRRRLLALGSGAFLVGESGCKADRAPLPIFGPSPRMRRGVNIHHMLNWPEMLGGQYRWPAYTDEGHQTSSSELSALRSAGFDFVRLTVDPAIYLSADARQAQALRAIYLDRISAILNAGFETVILDLHPVSQNPNLSNTALSGKDFPVGRLSQMVRELASMLEAAPPGRTVLEMFNEPPLWKQSDLTRWSRVQVELHKSARAGSAWLPVVLTGGRWSAPKSLIELETAPYAGSNVLYTFHFYDPKVYTHQSVSAEAERYVQGLAWPPRSADKQAALSKMKARIQKDSSLAADKKIQIEGWLVNELSSYFAISDPEKFISNTFDGVARWTKEQGVDPHRVLLGEFGATRQDAETAELRQSRLRWLRTVRQEAERHRFPWAFWGYRGIGMNLASFDKRWVLDSGILSSLGLGGNLGGSNPVSAEAVVRAP